MELCTQLGDDTGVRDPQAHGQYTNAGRGRCSQLCSMSNLSWCGAPDAPAGMAWWELTLIVCAISLVMLTIGLCASHLPEQAHAKLSLFYRRDSGNLRMAPQVSAGRSSIGGPSNSNSGHTINSWKQFAKRSMDRVAQMVTFSSHSASSELRIFCTCMR